jgi:hypothetical protein
MSIGAGRSYFGENAFSAILFNWLTLIFLGNTGDKASPDTIPLGDFQSKSS